MKKEEKKKTVMEAMAEQSNQELGTKDNLQYKNDFFVLLMNEKKYALEVYNALNGSDYKNPDDIQIITLQYGVKLSIYNDASFVLDRQANYYEHQASYNPNMPLRSFLFFAEDLKKWLDADKSINIYGSKRVQIPTPHFVVFYNGRRNRPEYEVQKLSFSFSKETDDPDLEVKCHVYNINPNNNTEFLKKTPALSGYVSLIEKIRNYEENMETNEAIHYAIDDCIEEGILKDFLISKRSQVEGILMLDFTVERQVELERAEAEKERKRADKAEKRLDEAEKRLNEEKQKVEEEKQRAEDAEKEAQKYKELLKKNGIKIE